MDTRWSFPLVFSLQLRHMGRVLLEHRLRALQLDRRKRNMELVAHKLRCVLEIRRVPEQVESLLRERLFMQAMSLLEHARGVMAKNHLRGLTAVRSGFCSSLSVPPFQ